MLMRAEEIREMGTDEIRSRIAEMEEERFRLRFRGATETLEEPLRLRTMRRDIARLNTVLRERELGVKQPIAQPAAAAPTSPAGGKRERARSARGGARK
jgi:large subunit ribosomal protein L29